MSWLVIAINKSSILPSIVLGALVLAIVGSSLPVQAGQSRLARRHSPVEVLRDANGDPIRTRDMRYVTLNWSGYVLPKFQTGKKYTAAQATWVVPAVSFHGVESASSSWIGIGGFCANKKCTQVDQTLIQLGTEQDAISKTETDYYAWYEMLPDFSIMTPLVVSPGDVITASLSCTGDCSTGQWALSMTNETTAMNWSGNFSYGSPNLSVEVIEEAPTGGSGILPLADFGKATFTATTAESMSVDLSKGDSVVMVDKQPHHRVDSSSVSAPDSTKDGFNACFNSHKSFAKCAKP